MFAWISMMVDADIFDVIDVYFLVVGHTHASIDQYFSVLAKQIMRCDFIGSPLALEALLGRERLFNLTGKSWKQEEENAKPRNAKPLVIRKLSVIFDLKSLLFKMIDFSIKYYSIPHRFQFKKYNGVAAMQYSVYSTQKELLPPRPTQLTREYYLVCAVFTYMIYIAST